MRAVQLTKHGGFEALDVRDDVAVPEPAAGQVLIQVAAAGVNNTDINTRVGWYAPDIVVATPAGDEAVVQSARADISWSGEVPTFPRIQGADACGRIVTVGSGVDASRIGERVHRGARVPRTGRAASAIDLLRLGDRRRLRGVHRRAVPARGACGLRLDGRRTGVGARARTRRPRTCSTRARVAVGETVVVTGASGGVGSAAVQLAKRDECASDRGLAAPAKHDEVTRARRGRRCCRATASLNECARAAGRSMLVIDVVGGPTWAQLVAVLRPGGRYATSGAIGGPWVELD